MTNCTRERNEKRKHTETNTNLVNEYTKKESENLFEKSKPKMHRRWKVKLR